MTCIQKVLLFTSYEGNVDNQLRCRHQPKSCRWLSAESHCGYTSSLLCCWASAFWKLPRAPIRDWGQQGHLPCPRCSLSHRAQAPRGPEDVVPSALVLICSQTDFSDDLLRVHLATYLQCKFLWKELCVSVAL